MQCLYCGKPLGLLRELSESEFCSRDHQQRYRRVTARAFTRLMETQSAPARRQPPQHWIYCRLPSPEPAPAAPRRHGPAGPCAIAIAGLASPEITPATTGLVPACAGAAALDGPAPLLPAAHSLAEAHPLQFSSRIARSLFARLQLLNDDWSPGELDHSPGLAPGVVDSLMREAEGAHRPVREVLAQVSNPGICLPSAMAAAGNGSSLLAAAFRFASPAALPMAPKMSGAPVPILPAARLSMPLPGVTGVFAPSPAGLLPLGMPEAGAVASEMTVVEPIPCWQAPPVRRPELSSAPDCLTLRTREIVPEEIFGADIVERPAGVAVTPSLASGSVLPALASLFRYGRLARPTPSLPHMTEGVVPRNRLAQPAAYRELPMPAKSPLVPRTSGLRIVETFEYLRPMEAPAFGLFQRLVQLWTTAPVYLRYAAVSACLILLFWAYVPRGGLAQLAASRWSRIEEGIGQRAAVELTEDFQGGMETWDGAGNWPRTWQISKAGYVRPGKLALYQPSMRMREYHVEFLMQVEKKAVSWAYRAADQDNYYASKITIVKPGPLPILSLVRYPVIGGREGPRVEIPIRVLMHNNTPYRVQLTVNSGGFATSIEGQLVDFWRDDSLKVGGFGFFSDTGESARVYWMKLNHQDDFIGRVCAYLNPAPVNRRRTYRPQ
ncbi:MAG TPA: hypothetical protein VLH09_09445 [Bryobacteraceae bacterium]|nr:hypothetical protein [Bryobacteraceae bacterium]